MHDPEELQRWLAQLSLDGPVEPFLVFADWLQSHGDPWGEFIAVQCASRELLELHAGTLWNEQERMLAEHGRTWCPLYGRTGRIVRWGRGFVRYIGYLEDTSHQELGRELQQLFREPAAALFTELSFHDAHLDSTHVRALLMVKQQLARMTELDLERNWFVPELVRELQAAFPRARLANQRAPRDAEHESFLRSWRGG
ncbi:MAG: TIGR02996 domain-containing protein [Kofleriaceae bacterium]